MVTQLRIIMTLLVCCGPLLSGGSLVSFAELTEVVINGGALRTVEAIQEDLLNPGGYIIGNGHSVTIITPNQRKENLAGNENETTFVNGIGERAYFAGVQDVAQINNGADILVADYNNHCIRKVNRASRRVTTYAGRCTQRGEVTGTVNARRARMTKPVKILHISEQNIIYYLLERPAAILKHDLSTDDITQVYQDMETFKYPFSFVAAENNKYLYVNHLGGISKFDTQTWRRTVIAGTNSSIGHDSEELRDGTLLESRFYYLTGLAWLIQDQVLIVNQPLEHSLRIVNMEDNSVSTICQGQTMTNPTFVLGGPGNCSVYSPYAATVINGTVYIGDISGKSGGSRGRRGHILKLEYHQPICFPPPADNTPRTYAPVQTRYTNKQNITYTCDEGFGIASNHTSRQCVRSVSRDGSVSGRWDSDPPVCQRPYISSIFPLRGQSAGGSKITLTGVFPATVHIAVVNADNTITPVHTSSRKNHNQITFSMPASQSTTNSVVRIQVVFEQGPGMANISMLYMYQYIPNPTVTSISRSSSIASGGLDISFSGRHIASTHEYSLSFYEDNLSTTPISTVSCTIQGVAVACKIPDLTQLFNKPANTLEITTARVSLLSDGYPVSGAVRFELTVVNSLPTFDSLANSFPIQFDLRRNQTLTLNGTDLNVSLTESDYQVNLLLESGSVLDCQVTRVMDTTLECQPPVESITIPPSETNIMANIQVHVAGVTKIIRKVAFYRSFAPGVVALLRCLERGGTISQCLVLLGL